MGRIDDRNDRIGEIRKMNCGDYAKLIEYNDSTDVVIKFQDDYGSMKHARYHNFKNGTIKNPYHKNQYGGYVGDGGYSVSKNRKGTYIYDAWIRMLERSLSKKYKLKFPSYSDATCCDEWLCFQNFAKWYEDHYYSIDGASMELDKDWIKFGNKTYCPELCEIVPSIINSCISNHAKVKNNNLPTGIGIHNNKYQARVNIKGKRVDCGHYLKLEDAMRAYRNAKINYVMSLAEEYRQLIPKSIYGSMINFDKRFDKEFPEYAEIQ